MQVALWYNVVILVWEGGLRMRQLYILRSKFHGTSFWNLPDQCNIASINQNNMMNIAPEGIRILL
jgi:hypothetical protein